MKKILHLLIVMLSFGLVQKSTAQDLPIITDYGKIIKNIEYNKDTKRKLDLYLSKFANPQQPFVILVHGGMYTAGDKANMEDVALMLMENNISSVSIDYRLMSNAFFVEQTPYYVTIITDVWRAMQFCKEESESWNIRDGRYTVLGNEAGGHIALLSAYKFYEDVENVIALNPMTDFTDLRLIRNPYLKGNVNATKSFISKVMDNTIYDSGIEPPQIYMDASPLYQFRNVPTFMIHGKLNNRVPYSQSKMLYDALTAYNISAKLLSVEDYGTGLLNDYASTDIIYPEIIEWLMSIKSQKVIN